MTIKNSEDTPKKESSSQEEPSLDSLLASSRLFFNVMSWFLNGIRKGRRIPTIFIGKIVLMDGFSLKNRVHYPLKKRPSTIKTSLKTNISRF